MTTVHPSRTVVVSCRDCALPLGVVPIEHADALYLCRVCEDLVDTTPVEGWELVRVMAFPVLAAAVFWLIIAIYFAAR